MRRHLLLLTLAVLAACTRDPLFPGLPRFRHEPPGHKPPAVPDSVRAVAPGPHVWATAVRFPDGYDWEVDTCAVEGDVWLDLYCDGVLVRSVPAGESLPGDMHRFAGGHLYADRSTDSETVLYRDGEELFRFEGRESVRGFRVLEDGVHTLGQDRDGEGVTYRIDGREVFRSPAGSVFGDGDAFSEVGGELCYFYCVKGNSRREFRIMREAELTGTAEPEGTVYDFRLVDGKACWVQFLRGGLSLVMDGKEKVLGLKSGEKVRSCRIFPGTDGLNLAVQAEKNGIRHAIVLTAGGSMFHLQDGMEVGPVLSDGEDTGWILTSPDGALLFMRAQGISLSIPGKGFLYGDCCATYSGGHLYLALSGRFGEPGRLVRDTEETEIAFNGYFTSVTLE